MTGLGLTLSCRLNAGVPLMCSFRGAGYRGSSYPRGGSAHGMAESPK